MVQQTERLDPKDEFAQRGNDIYERVVRPTLKPEDRGKFVAIDIDTGEFALDEAPFEEILPLISQGVGLHRFFEGGNKRSEGIGGGNRFVKILLDPETGGVAVRQILPGFRLKPNIVTLAAEVFRLRDRVDGFVLGKRGL